MSIPKMSGDYGTVAIANGTLTRAFETIVINEADSQITALYYSSDTSFGTNLVSTLGLSGLALGAGQVIYCKGGETFGKITVTGSVLTQ
jgi:hypothetical protein